MRTTFGRRFSQSIVIAILVTGLIACGDKSNKKPASQVAAKVNAEEISVHQINFVLGRANAGAIPPEQAPRVRREILEKLIDQQLAVENAVEDKLDRSPEVLMALEAARREILSRAYLEKIAAAQPKPTQEEAKKYIAEHPQLFAERRVFSIREITLPISSNLADRLRDMLSAGKSMEDIANLLKSQDVKFVSGSATRSAEQIPLDLLPKLNALKDGQGMVQENGQNVTAVQLVSSQSAPISEEVALPRVLQFLSNQRVSEAAEREIKQIREKAKITYIGEFSESVPVSSASTKAASDPTNAIEKGVAGLK